MDTETLRTAIRVVILKPYLKGRGPTFTLRIWDTGERVLLGPQQRLIYRLTQSDKKHRIFFGEDFGCSPLHAIDGDECVLALMNFLCLRPGDTDAEYFDHYTEEQLEFCSQHSEALGYEAYLRFDKEARKECR